MTDDRRRRRRRSAEGAVLTFTALCAAPSAALAQANDPRLWTSIVVSAPVGSRLQVKADALVETTSTGSRTGLELVRVLVLRQASERVTYGGGYTWVQGVTATGARYTEHRAVQELGVILVSEPGRVRLTTRTRLEERSRESGRGVALRVRHQTRAELPIEDTVRFVAWNEYFHGLNGVRWSGQAGPALMLNFVGVQMPLTKAVAVEPGYLNQLTFGRGRSKVGHVGALSVTYRF